MSEDVPPKPPNPTIGFLATSVQDVYSGPIPHPALVEGYERILPGSAERILAMAEREQTFRHRLIVEQVSTATKLAKRGQWMGFVLGFVGITGGLVLAGMGKSVTGLTSFIFSLSILVAIYWDNRQRMTKELEKSQKTEPAKGKRP